eukprot:12109095-Alexandrium_andersonii.AAC.1
MSASLVGSEMCIRDRASTPLRPAQGQAPEGVGASAPIHGLVQRFDPGQQEADLAGELERRPLPALQ